MAKEEKAVATTEENALVAAGEYEAYADAGFSGVTDDMLAVSKLLVIQSNSPQLKPESSAYIEGAQQGQIVDMVTRELFDFMEVVACSLKRTWVEKTPKIDGGSKPEFVAEYRIRPSDATIEMRGPGSMPNGNALHDTRNFFILRVKDGETFPAFISMSSTQLREASRWTTIMGNQKGQRKDGTKYRLPMYSSIYGLGTRGESNKVGDWYGWHVSGPLNRIEISSEIFNQAKTFCGLIENGGVEVVEPSDDIPYE